MEKRKSAYMRFGRSDPELADQLMMEKRKSAYMRSDFSSIFFHKKKTKIQNSRIFFSQKNPFHLWYLSLIWPTLEDVLVQSGRIESLLTETCVTT